MKIFGYSFLFFVFLISAPLARAEYPLSYVGDQVRYDAKYEDTFVHLARDYHLGFTEMRAANPSVDPWLPGAGTDLILPTRHLLPDAPKEGIVINLPEMRLYAYINGDEAPVTYPLGVGREGLETPTGTTEIVRKKVNPVWRPTPRMRREDPELKEAYGEGPDNPMGNRALYLGWPQYAIHGTNRPFGIGRRISSGCIRMYPEDVEVFFEQVDVGTKVTVVNQPIKVGWIDNKLYIEVSADLDHAIEMEENARVAEPAKLSDEDMERIIRAAGVYKDRIRWAAVRTAVRERRGYPVYIARRPGYEVDEARTQDMNSSEKLEALEEQDIVEAKLQAQEALEEIYDKESEEKKAETEVSQYKTLNP